MLHWTLHLLAQTQPAPSSAPPVAPTPPLLTLDTLFWFSVLAIFLITIFSALLRRLAKDKALKLFHEYHVTFFSERRGTIWGDMLVSSQGVELLFSQAFITRRNLVKSSALLYEDEFTPMICLTRSIHGLTAQEAKDRTAQIQRTFKPGMFRRSNRWFRNMLNTMRDAITKTMTLVIGRMSAGAAASGALAGTAITAQGNDLTALTSNVVSLAANAYEPLLERYIGQPVVLEINLPAPPGPPPPPNFVPETVEFPGYLVDYTQKFIAVFNVDHTPVETIDITFAPGQPHTPQVPELKITTTGADTIIKCEGKDAFVLRRVQREGESTDLGIAMIPGTTLILAALDTAPTILTVERTRQIDLVVPRTRARVRFGSMPARTTDGPSRSWLGIAPLLEPREFLQSLRDNVHTVRKSLFNNLHLPREDAPQKSPPSPTDKPPPP